ncbi:MAG: DMT family transporter [Actinomycetota bacterium]|nr:DMT family transporter [Actinomycetota bacterium]
MRAPVGRGRPLLGYGLVGVASFLGGVNAILGKVVMTSGGLTPERVSQLRAAGAALVLLVAVALFDRRKVFFTRREVAFLAVFGVFGLAAAQFLYYTSLQRVPVGPALLIVNFAIVLVAVWARFFGGGRVQRRLWLAIALTLVGLSLLAQVWRGLAFDAVGIGAALLAAFTYAFYILVAERGVHAGRHGFFLVAWGFFFASAFWAIAEPWWTFPYHLLGARVSLLGALSDWTAPVWLLFGPIIPFTIATFALPAAALRYLPATRVVIVAVLEPVFGALVAFVWLDESLALVQLAGGVLVLAGVLAAATARALDAGPGAVGEDLYDGLAYTGETAP